MMKAARKLDKIGFIDEYRKFFGHWAKFGQKFGHIKLSQEHRSIMGPEVIILVRCEAFLLVENASRSRYLEAPRSGL